MYALYCTLAKECKFSYYISMATGKKLGENLRKLRLKKNMSQGGLATALSVDRAYVSNIENGRMNPTLSTLGESLMLWKFLVPARLWRGVLLK